ncbi:MAG TPA: PadR family transcriptional regulator [Candidatus Dormibacteraeota bacterium]
MHARHSAYEAEPWAPFRREAAERLHRFAHAAGRRHGHGWPPFDPADFGGFRSWGGGFGGGPPWARGGRRAGRGDIRAAILVLLAEKPSHGYQIIQELEARSGGAWRVSPGSVYPTLQQLEDEGLVRIVAGETERRVYELTDAGKAEAERLGGERAPWDQVAGAVPNELVELKDLVIGLVAATWQVARAGESAQIAAAKDILRDARKRLYMLLAGEAQSPSEKAES